MMATLLFGMLWGAVLNLPRFLVRFAWLTLLDAVWDPNDPHW